MNSQLGQITLVFFASHGSGGENSIVAAETINHSRVRFGPVLINGLFSTRL